MSPTSVSASTFPRPWWRQGCGLGQTMPAATCPQQGAAFCFCEGCPSNTHQKNGCGAQASFLGWEPLLWSELCHLLCCIFSCFAQPRLKSAQAAPFFTDIQLISIGFWCFSDLWFAHLGLQVPDCDNKLLSFPGAFTTDVSGLFIVTPCNCCFSRIHNVLLSLTCSTAHVAALL